MVKIKAYQNKLIFRSKYGEILPDDDNIGIEAAMMCGRFERKEILLHEAYGNTIEEAQRQIDHHIKYIGFNDPLRIEIIKE